MCNKHIHVYIIYTLCIHSVYTLYTFYIHYIYSLYTLYILYIHFVYNFYTLYTHFKHTFHTHFRSVLAMFRGCSRDALQMFQGCFSIVLLHVYNTFTTFSKTFFRNCSECIILQNKYIGQNRIDPSSSKIEFPGLKTIKFD